VESPNSQRALGDRTETFLALTELFVHIDRITAQTTDPMDVANAMYRDGAFFYPSALLGQPSPFQSWVSNVMPALGELQWVDPYSDYGRYMVGIQEPWLVTFELDPLITVIEEAFNSGHAHDYAPFVVEHSTELDLSDWHSLNYSAQAARLRTIEGAA
jgi:hypothetical protein